jgi:transcriptional regulator with PAS, ATPase and Fis domain
MDALRSRIARVASTSFTVLIEGESGAGKELVARELHRSSPRRRGPFVAVNCAALVETLLEAELFGIEERTATGVRGRRGKFELADGGTLFLDEVADLSPAAQAKLLRVLQDMSVERVGAYEGRAVDTRVIAATNRSLTEQVRTREFRADLYYRLAGVEVRVPPLRHRREDVPELADHILARCRKDRPLALSPGAADALATFDWPGNVRQLERVLERAVALSTGPVVELEDLPEEITAPYCKVLAIVPGRDESLRAWSSRYVRLILDRCGGNKRRACDVLNISFHTLQAYLGYSQAPALPNAEPAEATSAASHL